MKSIFWKIFLSFLVLMVAVAGIAVQVSYRLSSERAAQINETSRIDIIRAAENALQQRGSEGFENWLANDAVLPPAQTVYLIDDAGADILGRELPRDVRSALRRLQRNENRARNGRIARHFRFPRISDAEDRQYRFFFGPSKPPLFGVLSTPGANRVILLLALLVSAIACYLLTRALTAPLGPIMRAAKQLTAGHLDARVGANSHRRDELGELARQFDTMADALQEQVSSRQELLRNVSHELRSPVARIQVALELARRQPEHIEQHLGRIEAEARQMESLTAQMLDLARAQTNAAPPMQTVDLAEVLHRVQADAEFEGKPDGKEIELTLHTTTLLVMGHHELLHSAIENIVRNALRFTPPGSRIDIIGDVNEAQIVIQIRDNGPGVSEADLPHLFEPFFHKGDNAGSAGVGLAVSAQVIALHAGDIVARNVDAGTGLVVTVSLPHA
ncbi:MAG: ATP-binding protein [Pseudomonadota bacterium]